MNQDDRDNSAGRQRIGIGGAAAALFVVLASGVVVWAIFAMISTLVVETPTNNMDRGVNEAGDVDRLAHHVDQFNGRTMFFTPAEPPPPRVERAPVDDSEPRIEPPPARYGGPSVIGMANDTIWFSDKRHMTVGGEAVGDLRVVSTNGAWQILVEWKGIEFEVPFLTRDGLILPPGPGTSRAGAAPSAEIASNVSESGTKPGGTPSESGEESAQEDSGSREVTQPGDDL